MIRSLLRSEYGANDSHWRYQVTVAIVMDFEGGTLEQYDEVIERMGFKPGGPGAPGTMGHWVTKADTGIRVTDVWAAKEQFEAFDAEQISLHRHRLGIDHPPTFTFYDVHDFLTARLSALSPHVGGDQGRRRRHHHPLLEMADGSFSAVSSAAWCERNVHGAAPREWSRSNAS